MSMSAALHAAMILLAVFGLPLVFEAREIREQTIIVELLPVAEETTPPPPEIEPPKEAEVPEPKAPEPEPEPV